MFTIKNFCISIVYLMVFAILASSVVGIQTILNSPMPFVTGEKN